jgi:transposase-like protein
MRKKGAVGNKVKAQAALEAAKGLQPLSQIAKRFGVHPIQIGKWRSKLVERAHEIFEDGGVVSGATHEREVADLYEQIGRLKVENDFLKKKSGLIS